MRFETTEVAAERQADAVVALAKQSEAGATIVRGDQESALWADHDRRPWARDGAVIKITLLPAAIAPTLRWIDEIIGGRDYDVIGRAGVGVLVARVGGDVEEQARVIDGLRERLRAPAGSAVLVRGTDELAARVNPWGPIGDGFAVMRAIKRQFDPRDILNPGRGPGGL